MVVDSGHFSDGQQNAGHGALRNRLLIDGFDERPGRKRSDLKINPAKYGFSHMTISLAASAMSAPPDME